MGIGDEADELGDRDGEADGDLDLAEGDGETVARVGELFDLADAVLTADDLPGTPCPPTKKAAMPVPVSRIMEITTSKRP